MIAIIWFDFLWVSAYGANFAERIKELAKECRHDSEAFTKSLVLVLPPAGLDVKPP